MKKHAVIATLVATALMSTALSTAEADMWFRTAAFGPLPEEFPSDFEDPFAEEELIVDEIPEDDGNIWPEFVPPEGSWRGAWSTSQGVVDAKSGGAKGVSGKAFVCVDGPCGMSTNIDIDDLSKDATLVYSSDGNVSLDVIFRDKDGNEVGRSTGLGGGMSSGKLTDKAFPLKVPNNAVSAQVNVKMAEGATIDNLDLKDTSEASSGEGGPGAAEPWVENNIRNLVNAGGQSTSYWTSDDGLTFVSAPAPADKVFGLSGTDWFRPADGLQYATFYQEANLPPSARNKPTSFNAVLSFKVADLSGAGTGRAGVKVAFVDSFGRTISVVGLADADGGTLRVHDHQKTLKVPPMTNTARFFVDLDRAAIDNISLEFPTGQYMGEKFTPFETMVKQERLTYADAEGSNDTEFFYAWGREKNAGRQSGAAYGVTGTRRFYLNENESHLRQDVWIPDDLRGRTQPVELSFASGVGNHRAGYVAPRIALDWLDDRDERVGSRVVLDGTASYLKLYRSKTFATMPAGATSVRVSLEGGSPAGLADDISLKIGGREMGVSAPSYGPDVIESPGAEGSGAWTGWRSKTGILNTITTTKSERSGSQAFTMQNSDTYDTEAVQRVGLRQIATASGPGVVSWRAAYDAANDPTAWTGMDLEFFDANGGQLGADVGPQELLSGKPRFESFKRNVTVPAGTAYFEITMKGNSSYIDAIGFEHDDVQYGEDYLDIRDPKNDTLVNPSGTTSEKKWVNQLVSGASAMLPGGEYIPNASDDRMIYFSGRHTMDVLMPGGAGSEALVEMEWRAGFGEARMKNARPFGFDLAFLDVDDNVISQTDWGTDQTGVNKLVMSRRSATAPAGTHSVRVIADTHSYGPIYVDDIKLKIRGQDLGHTGDFQDNLYNANASAAKGMYGEYYPYDWEYSYGSMIRYLSAFTSEDTDYMAKLKQIVDLGSTQSGTGKLSWTAKNRVSVAAGYSGVALRFLDADRKELSSFDSGSSELGRTEMYGFAESVTFPSGTRFVEFEVSSQGRYVDDIGLTLPDGRQIGQPTVDASDFTNPMDYPADIPWADGESAEGWTSGNASVVANVPNAKGSALQFPNNVTATTQFLIPEELVGNGDVPMTISWLEGALPGATNTTFGYPNFRVTFLSPFGAQLGLMTGPTRSQAWGKMARREFDVVAPEGAIAMEIRTDAGAAAAVIDEFGIDYGNGVTQGVVTPYIENDDILNADASESFPAYWLATTTRHSLPSASGGTFNMTRGENGGHKDTLYQDLALPSSLRGLEGPTPAKIRVSRRNYVDRMYLYSYDKSGAQIGRNATLTTETDPRGATYRVYDAIIAPGAHSVRIQAESSQSGDTLDDFTLEAGGLTFGVRP